MSVTSRLPDFRRVWLWPLLIGIASAIGLFSALLGDGMWDALSWATLAIPVAVVLGVARRGLKARRRNAFIPSADDPH